MKLNILLLLFLSSSANAFVTHRSTARHISRHNVNKIGKVSSLNMLEPTQIFDQVMTTLVTSDASSTLGPPESGGVSYSKASYYTILGLYLLSFPGLWSTIKRSTKAKVKRKTFVTKGEKASTNDGKSLRQEAGEIMAYMKANNYEVVDAGETITFRGIVARSLSQAFFLTFCTALGLLSLALVLQIQFNDFELPGIGQPNWYMLALLSPYAGIYYWRSGDRVDECSFKLSTNEQETMNEIIVQGSEEEIERMWRALDWQEKGMVKITGLLDQVAWEDTQTNSYNTSQTKKRVESRTWLNN